MAARSNQKPPIAMEAESAYILRTAYIGVFILYTVIVHIQNYDLKLKNNRLLQSFYFYFTFNLKVFRNLKYYCVITPGTTRYIKFTLFLVLNHSHGYNKQICQRNCECDQEFSKYYPTRFNTCRKKSNIGKNMVYKNIHVLLSLSTFTNEIITSLLLISEKPLRAHQKANRLQF